MIARAEFFRTRDDEPQDDHIVFFWDVSWEDYERVLEMRGDKSAPRITYLEGTVQIMSPSRDHEAIKSLIGRLVEVYCLDRDIDFMPFGNWTIGEKKVRRAAEPDECYVFGAEKKDLPDLAIEVEWTRGGIDKLEVYRKLGVSEVWRWRKGRITVHVLRGETYEDAERSVLLPDLDLALLATFVDRTTVNQAVRDFRAALAARE